MFAFYGVRPRIGLYDDKDEPGAYTYPPDADAGPEGTVVFGRRMFQDQLTRYQDNGMSLLGIFAHEIGHAFQFVNKLDSILIKDDVDNGVRFELHADFMAGFYLAYLKRKSPDTKLYDSGRTFQVLADGIDQNASHGKPDQRLYAINFGYTVGMNNPDALPKDVAVDAAKHLVAKFRQA